MQFHMRPDLFPYRGFSEQSHHMKNRLSHEWKNARRPYYKCWPEIITALQKISLNLTFGQLALQQRVLALRFPVDNEPALGKARIRTLLTGCLQWDDCTSFTIEADWLFDEHRAGLGVLWITSDDNRSIDSFIDFTHTKDEKEQIDYLNKTGWVCSSDFGNKLWKSIFRISLTCHLLANDPSILEPDVLASDQDKYLSSGDSQYIDKAHRRGKIGWHVGRSFQSIPHYRRPHLALRHTGKGRTVPRIVPIRGCFVHRDKVTRVPTGWITDEGVEIEPQD